MKNNIIWAILLLVIFLSLSNHPNTSTPKSTVTITASNQNELASLVNAGVIFTGADKYISGTALSSESVRILNVDGKTNDLGFKSLNSDTLGVKPNENYKFYFFMNTTPSTTHYVDVQQYTGKVQESSDNVIGHGCTIDTAPLITVLNSAGSIQSAYANAETLGAATTRNIDVIIKSHSDKCYGTPGAPKGNVICFGYAAAAFSSVKANSKFTSLPASVSSVGSGSFSCFEFPVLEDGESVDLGVQLVSNGDPTTAHNISIYTDDISVDLNQETLAEIWEYADESGNQLARVITSTPDGYIRVA